MKDDAISREMALGAVCGALIGTRYQKYAVSAIKLIPALDGVPVKHDEELGTSLIHVEDIDDWQDRIILLEDGSKSCAVYYADAEEEDAAWYQKRITVPKGRGQTYLVWACSKCHGHEKKRSKFCPNCGKRMTELPTVQSPADLKND